MALLGSIYIITQISTGKSYVGQTQHTKIKNNKPYKYGILGRWSDHISSSLKNPNTPLSKSIYESGIEDFKISSLESDILSNLLDEREAHWIQKLNTTIPNGFNVMRHSRCKHRDKTTIALHYLPTTVKIRLSYIKRCGVNKLIHLYLYQLNSATVRLVFGQNKLSTFDDALTEAKAFIGVFIEKGIEFIKDDSDDLLMKHRKNINMLKNKIVTNIRVAKFNYLIALYITYNEGILRMCFGGKTILQKTAYNTAIIAKDILMDMHPCATFKDDVSKSATSGCL